jgi:hypothetical protein
MCIYEVSSLLGTVKKYNEILWSRDAYALRLAHSLRVSKIVVIKKSCLPIIFVQLALVFGVHVVAHAQAYDKLRAKSITLTGNGSTTNTYTIKAPTLMSPLTFTFPSALGSITSLLLNDGSGNLTWGLISLLSDIAPGPNNNFFVTNASGISAWSPLDVDGVTLTGNGIGTALGINLANSNIWTVAQTVQKNAIATTPTDAVVLSNTTAAAAGAQQYSPRLHLSGQGWETGTSASKEVDWFLQNVPVQGATNPTSYLDFESGLSNASYASRFDVFSSGGATLGIASPTDPGAGVLNLGTGLQIAGGAPAGALLISNGTEFVASTLLYPFPGSAGNVIRSNGSNFISTAPNKLQYNTLNTYSYTTNTTANAEMMGLGQLSPAVTFTPTYSGKILIIVSGTLQSVPNDAPTSPATLQLHYGTGTAPAANTNAAGQGTATGSIISVTTQNHDNHFFFTLTSIVTGLTISTPTPIWIDVAVYQEQGSTTATIFNPTISVEEF